MFRDVPLSGKYLSQGHALGRDPPRPRHPLGPIGHLRMTQDLDLIGDAEHPGHGVFGGNALSVMAHRVSQEDTALTSGRLEAVRDRAIRRERLVRKLDYWAAA